MGITHATYIPQNSFRPNQINFSVTYPNRVGGKKPYPDRCSQLNSGPLILLIPIALYIVSTTILIWIVGFAIKSQNTKARKGVKKWIVITSVILFFPLGFLYILYLSGLALENHYDVKRGTFLWYATMDNETITNFPIIEPAGEVRFNSIGGDSPNIGTGWGIEYESAESIKPVSKQLIQYLRSEGYNIQPVERTQYYWIGRHEKSENNELYSGSNEIGESLDLLIERKDNESTRIECSIVH